MRQMCLHVTFGLTKALDKMKQAPVQIPGSRDLIKGCLCKYRKHEVRNTEAKCVSVSRDGASAGENRQLWSV